MPKKMFAVMLIVSDPTSVQLIPSDELYPENEFPLRTTLTQYGATTLTPEVFMVPPPVVSRRWKATPLPGVRTIMAWVELAARLSRIMTPALAQGLVF